MAKTIDLAMQTVALLNQGKSVTEVRAQLHLDTDTWSRVSAKAHALVLAQDRRERTHIIRHHRGVTTSNEQIANIIVLTKLTDKHPSRPFNPDLANTLFRAGYIEAWGRGTLQMRTACRRHALPLPHYRFEAGGCTVTFFQYTTASLRQQGLREDLVTIVLAVQAAGTVTNSAVQQLTGTSKSTATRLLNELMQLGVLQKTGTTGVGTAYELKGS